MLYLYVIDINATYTLTYVMYYVYVSLFKVMVRMQCVVQYVLTRDICSTGVQYTTDLQYVVQYVWSEQ